MMILMLSMAGVPPLLGFFAKLAVLESVVDAGFIWLAVIAVVMSVVGAFYYLRIIILMYVHKAEDSQPIEAGFDIKAVLSLNGLIILGLGIFPSALLVICASSIM